MVHGLHGHGCCSMALALASWPPIAVSRRLEAGHVRWDTEHGLADGSARAIYTGSIEHAPPQGRTTAQCMAILAVGMWRKFVSRRGTSSDISCLLVVQEHPERFQRQARHGLDDQPGKNQICIGACRRCTGTTRSRCRTACGIETFSVSKTHPPTPDFVQGLSILQGDPVKGESDVVPIERPKQPLVPHGDELPARLQAEVIDPEITDRAGRPGEPRQLCSNLGRWQDLFLQDCSVRPKFLHTASGRRHRRHATPHS